MHESSFRKKLVFVESVVVPAILLLVGIAVLQSRAIPYWQARFGTMLGVVCSFGLETGALWLLYQPKIEVRRLGLLLAIILVTVPVYEVTSEPIARLSTELHSEHAKELTQVQDALNKSTSDVAYYRGKVDAVNSPFFRLKLSQAETKKAGDEGRLAALSSPWPSLSQTWNLLAEVLPVAGSFIAFIALNVLCITSIRKYRWPADRNEPPTSSPDAPSHPNPLTPPVQPMSEPLSENAIPLAPARLPVVNSTDEVTVRRLQHEIQNRLAKSGLSSRAWAKANSMNPSDVSLLKNHFDNVRDGKTTISAPKLAVLVKRFLTPGTENQVGGLS